MSDPDPRDELREEHRRAALAAAKDRLYNFTCDGCKVRHRKTGSQLFDDKRYCRSCIAVLGTKDPRYLVKPKGRHYETAEKRGTLQKRSARLMALIAWQERRVKQKRSGPHWGSGR